MTYLEQPYRLIRQDIQSDWTSMLRASPDALLFNVDSVNPSILLPKLRSLNLFQETPAIVLANEEKVDITTCDATILCQFNDPAVLIDSIEQAIAFRKESLEMNDTSHRSESDPQNGHEIILIVDLIGNISKSLIDALESKAFRVAINNGLTGMLETVLRIKPMLIVIHSKIDVTLKNFLRLLKMNRHTKGRSLIVLADNATVHRKNLQEALGSNINFFSVHSEPAVLAGHITALANHGH